MPIRLRHTVAALAAVACAAALCVLALPGGTAGAAVTYPYAWFLNENSGKCISVPDSSTTPGTQLHQYTCLTKNNFGWLPVEAGNEADEYFFRNEDQTAPNEQCMAVAGGSTSAGAAVVQEPCNYTNPPASQLWLAAGSGLDNGYGEFYNYKSGMCLKVNASSTKDDALMIQEPCSNGGAIWFMLSDTQP